MHKRPRTYLTLAWLLCLAPAGWAEDVLQYYNHGVKLLEQKNFAEAEKYLKHAVKLDATHWQSWQALGTARENLGDKEKALKAYDRSLGLNSNNPGLAQYAEGLRRRLDALSPKESKRKLFLGVGVVEKGSAQVNGLHKELRGGLAETFKKLGRYEVYDYGQTRQYAKRLGVDAPKTQADAVALCRAGSLDMVLLGKIVRGHVTRKKAKSGGKAAWEVYGTVEFTYELVEGASGSVVLRGSGQGTASRVVEREGSSSLSVGGVSFKDSGPSPSDFDDNKMHPDLAVDAARRAADSIGDAVFRQYPMKAKVTEIVDADKRICRIDAGWNLGLRKGDRFAPPGSGKADMKVTDVENTTSLCKYDKDLIPSVRPGLEVDAVKFVGR